MKKLSLFLLLLIQYSCTTEPVADTSENTVLLKDSLINVLRNTDIAWSETAAKKAIINRVWISRRMMQLICWKEACL